MPPRDFLRTLGRAMDRRQDSEADVVVDHVVVRPYDSRGLTVVRRVCNPQELVVSNRSGLTFAPGAGVMLGSNTGRPGKSIIAGAPPGRMGASAVPIDQGPVRTWGTAPTPAPTCPLPMTGKSYLAIYDDGTTLHAWIYADGDYISTAGTFNHSAAGWTVSGQAGFQRVHTLGDVVVFQGRKSARDRVMTWDVGVGTVADLNTDISQIGGPVWNGGTHLYFQESYDLGDGVHLALYRVNIGASGLFNYVTGLVGSEYVDATFDLSVPLHLCLSGGTAAQIPCFFPTSPPAVAIPYFNGSAWTLGAGRATIAGTEDTATGGNGYPISGGRSARVSYTAIGSPNIGLLPAGPATPELPLFPGGWGLTAIGDLSVSPDGSEVCLSRVATTGGDQFLLRVAVDDVEALPDGCEAPIIPINAGPAGVPAVMLCRD